MNTGSILAFVSLAVAVLGHAIATIWWAASITTTLKVQLNNISESLKKIDKELEKRDETIRAIWKRIDDLRDMING